MPSPAPTMIVGHAPFSKGDAVWFVQTSGATEEHNGCHSGLVTHVVLPKQQCVIRVEDPESVLNGQDVTTWLAKKTPDGASHQDYAALRDLAFNEEGYGDMVELKHLNDGELSRNIQLRMAQDLSYSFCGNTCIALNTFYRWEGYPPELHQALLKSRADWQALVKDYPFADDSNCPKEHEEGDFTGQVIECFAEDVKQRYVGQPRTANPPHVYSVVAETYNQLFNPTIDSPVPMEQAIVITGESGAGKTFTTQKVLDFLDTINSNQASELGMQGDSLTEKIMQTMPIMDAFGNACMPRNPDSSRFGKLYKIFFDRRSHLVTGATVQPYLLEKNRVCSQASWERNYHVFYQLLFGASPEMVSKYYLLGMQDYCYLNRFVDTPTMSAAARDAPGIQDKQQSVVQFDICDRNHFNATNGQLKPRFSKDTDGNAVLGLQDKKSFAKLMKALQKNNFTEQTIDEIWKITSACLLLGNITFEGELGDYAKILPASEDAMAKACALLEMDASLLEFGLKHKVVQAGGKPVKQNTNKRQALALRDALARTLYNDLFEGIVQQFSDRLRPKSESKDTWLGVLDIFGFEFVEQSQLVPGKVVNSFEQFCINLCNEKLQKHFVECVFGSEILNYKDQGLKITEDEFEFIPNTKTVDMLQSLAKDGSVLTILDGVCENPMARDAKGDDMFQEKLERTLRGNEPDLWEVKGQLIPNAFSVPPKRKRDGYEGGNKADGKTPRGGFAVQHYAASVIYDVDGWIEKNKDMLSQEIYDAVASSSLPRSEQLPASPSILNRFLTLRRPPTDDDGRKAKPKSLGWNFRSNLRELIDETLAHDKCKCSFVRCLKPNKEQIPELYSGALVLNQLQYTGMLDTLIIRKEGWPSRPTHVDFFFQYRPLCPSVAVTGSDGDPTDVDVAGLVGLLGGRFGYSVVPKGGQAPEAVKKVDIFMGRDRMLIKDDAAREMEQELNSLLKVHANAVQSVFLGCTNAKQFKTWQGVARVVNEARRVVAAAGAAHEDEEQHWGDSKAGQMDYLSKVGAVLEMEAEERRNMRAEEDYVDAYMHATARERFLGWKHEHWDEAETAYTLAKEVLAVLEERPEVQPHEATIAEHADVYLGQLLATYGVPPLADSELQSQVVASTHVKFKFKRREAGAAGEEGYYVIRHRKHYV